MKEILLGSLSFFVRCGPRIDAGANLSLPIVSSDTPAKALAKTARWHDIGDVPDTKLRVIFLPEPASRRSFLDAVAASVNASTSSILFSMYTATDKPLIEAILAQGDKGKLVYGLLNDVSDPHEG